MSVLLADYETAAILSWALPLGALVGGALWLIASLRSGEKWK